MLYSKCVLDRATGQLVEVNAGNWITVTELGEAYGVGRKKIRAILHHMGLLRPEGRHGRYRLTPSAVERGLGTRIDTPKSGRPFDVISPLGQRLIADAWADTVRDLEEEVDGDVNLTAAKRGFAEQATRRSRPMTTQEEVCWLRDRFPALSYAQVAKLLGVDDRLVSRYATQQTTQREYQRRRMAAPVVTATDRMALSDDETAETVAAPALPSVDDVLAMWGLAPKGTDQPAA